MDPETLQFDRLEREIDRIYNFRVEWLIQSFSIRCKTVAIFFLHQGAFTWLFEIHYLSGYEDRKDLDHEYDCQEDPVIHWLQRDIQNDGKHHSESEDYSKHAESLDLPWKNFTYEGSRVCLEEYLRKSPKDWYYETQSIALELVA